MSATLAGPNAREVAQRAARPSRRRLDRLVRATPRRSCSRSGRSAATGRAAGPGRAGAGTAPRTPAPTRRGRASSAPGARRARLGVSGSGRAPRARPPTTGSMSSPASAFANGVLPQRPAVDVRRTGSRPGRPSPSARWRVVRSVPIRTAPRPRSASLSSCGSKPSIRVQSATYGSIGSWAWSPTRCSTTSIAGRSTRSRSSCRAEQRPVEGAPAQDRRRAIAAASARGVVRVEIARNRRMTRARRGPAVGPGLEDLLVGQRLAGVAGPGVGHERDAADLEADPARGDALEHRRHPDRVPAERRRASGPRPASRSVGPVSPT